MSDLGFCPKCASSKIRRNGFTDLARKQRYQCADCGFRFTEPGDGTPPEQVAMRDQVKKRKVYIITAAQNATPVFLPFLRALERYAEHRKAELVAIPIRYRNPTSQWTEGNDDHEWWAAEVLPYLFNGRVDLNDNISILGDIKVQATATRPLSGLETISGARSAIVGHTKVQMQTIPTPSHKLPKIMMTTGAVTLKNYTDTKAGAKGAFHHTFGAVVVEISGDVFHMRQISAMPDGSFTDLDLETAQDGVRPAPPAAALVMGDTHVDFVDPDVVQATGDMARALGVKRMIWHDLLDFYSRNHHHRHDPFTAIAKFKAGNGCVASEVKRACAHLEAHTPPGVKSVVVQSNHNEAFARWIRETDWRLDPENAEFYLETALVMARAAEMTETGASGIDPFEHWAKQLCSIDVSFPARRGSYVVKNIELGMHGDKGPNGARGSIKGFTKIGVKSIIGHSHTPGIEEGTYQVGTSTRLQLEYTSGPSSWLNTHCVIYANGKRSLVNVIGGEWRL